MAGLTFNLFFLLQTMGVNPADTLAIGETVQTFYTQGMSRSGIAFPAA